MRSPEPPRRYLKRGKMRRKDRAGCGGCASEQKSLEISNHFSLFGCLRGVSAEREDPGRESKIFQNLPIGVFIKRGLIF